MATIRGDDAEVWLRGNPRPVVWLGGVALILVSSAVGSVFLVTRSPQPRWVAVAAGLVSAALVVVLARAARRPRLLRVGETLVVRLSPTGEERLPLDVVECFFQGSRPLSDVGSPTCEERSAFRVNTLIMRIAERAVGHADRRTFTPWGVWADGYVVFDGRWCEPLSVDVVRHLSHRLAEAKRERREAAATGGATP